MAADSDKELGASVAGLGSGGAGCVSWIPSFLSSPACSMSY